MQIAIPVITFIVGGIFGFFLTTLCVAASRDARDD